MLWCKRSCFMEKRTQRQQVRCAEFLLHKWPHLWIKRKLRSLQNIFPELRFSRWEGTGTFPRSSGTGPYVIHAHPVLWYNQCFDVSSCVLTGVALYSHSNFFGLNFRYIQIIVWGKFQLSQLPWINFVNSSRTIIGRDNFSNMTMTLLHLWSWKNLMIWIMY